MIRDIVATIDAAGALNVRDAAFRSVDGVSRQVLPVAGGVIEIDVSAPERGIGATIDDAVAASWWVPFVFGDAAAAALVELDAFVAGGDDPPPATLTVTADVAPETALDDVARRLLLGFWMRRWWPAGVVDARVCEWLLDAELGALAAEADTLFGSLRIAEALLSAHVPTITAEAEAGGAAGRDTGERRVLERAVLAAADVVDIDVPGYAALDDLAERIRAAGGLDAAHGFDAGPSSVVAGAGPVVAATREWAATGAGTPVDWSSVHPRQVSPAPDAIRVSVRDQAGDAVIDVSVDAPRDIVSVPVEPGELYARVASGEDVEAFVLVAEGERFRGSGVIPRGGQIAVSIYSDVYGTGGRDALDSAVVERVRADVVAIVTARRAQRERALIGPFAFERRLERDAARSAEIDAAVQAEMESADFDFDLELLSLTAAQSAMRSSIEEDEPDEFRAETHDADLRVEVYPRGSWWRVRLVSFGAHGEYDVSVLFASGATGAAMLTLPEEGYAEGDIGVAADDDVPVRVRARRRS